MTKTAEQIAKALTNPERKVLRGEAVRMGKCLEMRAIIPGSIRVALQAADILKPRFGSQCLTKQGEAVRELLLKDD